MEDFYSLKIRALWNHFKGESFSFWMICGYLFFEYVRPQSIYPAINFLPWASVFLMGAAAGWFMNGKEKWVRDPVNKWLLIMWVVIGLSCATAYRPDESWKHFRDFYIWVIVYFCIINTVTTQKRFVIFLLIFLLASFKISAFTAKVWAFRGFSYTSWGLQGPPGFFENSGELSMQMLMFSPVALELARFLKPWLSSLKYYGLLLFPLTGAMTIMGASSRGSQVALVYQIYHSMLKGRVSFKSIVLVVAVGYAAFYLLPDEQKNRFSSAGDDKTSQQRLLYWKRGIEMIGEHPVLGVGFFNFIPYFESFYRVDMLYDTAQLPHNIFIQVGTDAGISGLFVFLMVIYRNFRSNIETRKLTKEHRTVTPYYRVSVGLDAALWGFLIAGQFVTVSYYPFLWINLALSVCLRNIANQEYGEKKGLAEQAVTRPRFRRPALNEPAA
jgi:putative inorganic carbon (hco3(-)) transporter